MNYSRKGRRTFIKNASIAAAAATIGACTGNTPDISNIPCPEQADEDHEFIVIGSGFGGSITACRLTEAGKDVLLIERGREWDTGDGTQAVFSDTLGTDNRSTWLSQETAFPFGLPITFLRKYTGVLEKVEGINLKVLAPAALGGGTVTFGGILKKPSPEIFRQVFPATLSYEELDAEFFPRVMIELQASVMPDDVFSHATYLHNRVFKDQNEAAGIRTVDIPNNFDWNIIREEIAGTKYPSAISGESIFGCSSGAKNSAERNYLFKARQTGRLTVKTLHVVRDISKACDGRFVVSANIIDESGNTIARKRYRCRYLFLAAGSVGTSKLMVRAKALNTISGLPDAVGQGFGNNGCSMVVRDGLDVNTGAVQAMPPRYGAEDYANPFGPVFVEHFPFSIGAELRALGYNVMGLNSSRGYFEYVPEFDAVRIRFPAWYASGQKQVRQAAQDVVSRLNRANGGNTSFLLGFGKAPVDDITYHPLGGMVMGEATDMFGRVNGQPNLYVMDASVIPGSTACVNPALTICAIVERNIEKVIQEDLT